MYKNNIHSLRKQQAFCDATAVFLAKWCLRNKRRNSLPMTCLHLDLGSASGCSCCQGNLLQPIRSTSQIWEVTCHQYGISALISQTSICRKTNGGVAKCWQLFSQAVIFRAVNNRWSLDYVFLKYARHPRISYLWFDMMTRDIEHRDNHLEAGNLQTIFYL